MTVKNIDEITIGEVVRRLDDLKEDIKEGFRITHEKQNRTNGNVKANTEWRLQVCGTIKTLQKVVYGGVGLVLMATGGAIIKLIIL